MNCSELAQRFKGGGHARAAGIRMPGPLADARQQVLTAISEVL